MHDLRSVLLSVAAVEVQCPCILLPELELQLDGGLTTSEARRGAAAAGAARAPRAGHCTLLQLTRGVSVFVSVSSVRREGLDRVIIELSTAFGSIVAPAAILCKVGCSLCRGTTDSRGGLDTPL